MHRSYYQTPRGVVTKPPLTVEAWNLVTGNFIGYLQTWNEISAVFSERGADTLTINTTLDSFTKQLLKTDGGVMVVAKINGVRKSFIVKESKPYFDKGTHGIAFVQLNCAGVWDVLYRRINGPTNNGRLYPDDECAWSGGLVDLLEILCKNTPILPPSRRAGDNPTVHVYGQYSNSGDVLLSAVQNIGYWVDFEVKLPSDDPKKYPKPVVQAVIRAYRGDVHNRTADRPPQLDAPQAESWEFVSRLPAATHTYTYWDLSTETGENAQADWRFGQPLVQSDPRYKAATPWGEGEQVVELKPETVRVQYSTEQKEANENLEDYSYKILQPEAWSEAHKAQTNSQGGQWVSAEMSPVWDREFGVDGVTPLQYYIGDVFDTDLPAFPSELNPLMVADGAGFYIPTVITEVEIKVGAAGTDSFSVTPTSSLPDTWWADITHLVD